MENLKATKDSILTNLQNAAQLEKLYRADKTEFKQAFSMLYPEIKDNALSSFWYERLNFGKEEISWGTKNHFLFILIASVLAGVVAKFPAIFSIDEDYFFQRNIGFVVFPFLTAYFAWRNKLSSTKIIVLSTITLLSILYINYLPDISISDTLILSCIHIVLFLWSIMGYSFTTELKNASTKRLAFLKYNGDLLVMCALIVISGGILTAITIGLFKLIGLDITYFYSQYIIVMGLAAVPLVGTYLTQTNPQLVGKVSPVIAKIFSPLVLIMLLTYLVAIVYSGKDPYNDREFLLIFNALLIGVMAIIFFSVAGTPNTTKSNWEIWVILLLSVVTILVNGIALSAIIFRISEWGITPNRLAVLGSNTLILINLILVTAKLFKVLSKKSEIIEVGKTIAYYLPIYVIWTVIVTFVFPLLFGVK